MKKDSLLLQTGETEEGEEREILRIYITRTPEDNVPFLNFKISFPMQKDGESYWLNSETCVDFVSAQHILDHLRSSNKPKTFRTGLDYNRSFSIKNDWLRSQDCPCKKIRIVTPGNGHVKTAITKLNQDHINLVCDFIQDFLESECDNAIKADSLNTFRDNRLQNLESKINWYNRKIQEIAQIRDDIQEEITKMVFNKQTTKADHITF